MGHLEAGQIVVGAVAVDQGVDLLGQAAEGGARQVQEAIHGPRHREALLRPVHERRLARRRILRQQQHGLTHCIRLRAVLTPLAAARSALQKFSVSGTALCGCILLHVH